MNIKNIKKINGSTPLIEPLMVIAIFMMIIIGALSYYRSTTKTADPNFIDIVSLAQNLNESHSDKELITLNYNEIVPFQQSLFSQLDCSKLLCNPINLENYPPNTYLIIHYKNSNFESFSLYTKTDSSIFKFNNTPYSEWISQKTYNVFQKEQVDLLERELKRNPKKNPNIVNLITMFENVSIYKILDKDNSIIESDSCQPEKCSNVLSYINKPVNQKFLSK